jgi:hypothetical protein
MREKRRAGVATPLSGWIGSGDEIGFPALGSAFKVYVHLGEQDVQVDLAVDVEVLGGDGVLIPPPL